MSISKTRWCDCCGKEIPYDNTITHSEHEGHTVYCVTYDAQNDGNKDFCRFSKKGDKIFGLVDIHMHRSEHVSTVVLSDCKYDRCMDICKDCKIEFLRKTIEHLEKYGR